MASCACWGAAVSCRHRDHSRVQRTSACSRFDCFTSSSTADITSQLDVASVCRTDAGTANSVSHTVVTIDAVSEAPLAVAVNVTGPATTQRDKTGQPLSAETPKCCFAKLRRVLRKALTKIPRHFRRSSSRTVLLEYS